MKIVCAVAAFYTLVAAGVCAWFGAWGYVLACVSCTGMCLIIGWWWPDRRTVYTCNSRGSNDDNNDTNHAVGVGSHAAFVE